MTRIKEIVSESRMVRTALAMLVMLIGSRAAFAQGCALCYTQAASSGSRMIEALRSGILILIVPPTLMTIAVIAVCYRKRNEFQNPEFTNQSDSCWS